VQYSYNLHLFRYPTKEIIGDSLNFVTRSFLFAKKKEGGEVWNQSKYGGGVDSKARFGTRNPIK
jgi:hypothetical protein